MTEASASLSRSDERALRVFSLCVAGVASLLIVSPWFGHVDDSDSQLYQVVARHMAEDHAWFQLRYLPSVHPIFREHLPFGLWPYALGIRVAGEWMLPLLAAVFTLGTVLIVGSIAKRAAGPYAAAVAMLILATTESFFVHGGRPRLDPLLVLLTTAASGWVLLHDRPRWLGAVFLSAAATLVKGPFGLVPLASASAGEAVRKRSLYPLVHGFVATTLAALPFVAFLVGDRFWGEGTWWNGYVHDQLIASALGDRTDGSTQVLYPFVTIGLRFWPGLPLVLFGAWQALRPRAISTASEDKGTLKTVLVFCLLQLAALCLPQRKVWNHALIVYPGLAILCGLAVAPYAKRLALRVGPQAVRLSGIVIIAVAAVGCFSGLGAWLDGPGCVASREFRATFDRLRSGTAIVVAATPIDWKTVASLAAERRLVPYPAETIDQVRELESQSIDAPFALVRIPFSPLGSGWRQVGAGRDWQLWARAH